MVVGSPDEKPAFTQGAAAAQAAGYPGASLPAGTPDPTTPLEFPIDPRPTFDDELRAVAEPPSRGIISRRQEVARLHALGLRNSEIARLLNYTDAWVSTLLRDPYVQTEITKWRDRIVDDDAIATLKQASRDGARRVHSLILDPRVKETTALSASQFAVEMTHGKAKQAVSVENASLSAFTEMLSEMRSRGEVIDVTPKSVEAAGREEQGSDSVQQADPFDLWLDQNLRP